MTDLQSLLEQHRTLLELALGAYFYRTGRLSDMGYEWLEDEGGGTKHYLLPQSEPPSLEMLSQISLEYAQHCATEYDQICPLPPESIELILKPGRGVWIVARE